MTMRNQWTPHGKRLIALSMCDNGKSFIAAAMLLRRHGGDSYPVLHLLCQGIEVLGKGSLLISCYGKHQPRLRRYGHDLVKLTKAVENEIGMTILNSKIMQELENLNALYSGHYLRYASGINVLVAPESIGSYKVLRRTMALMRLAARKDFF
ncbi:hypothetical protein QK899_00210 [Pseudomonas sp. AR5]|nr:hypothetical protein QK899_00210 [Pseudomonas sp. AR5]